MYILNQSRDVEMSFFAFPACKHGLPDIASPGSTDPIHRKHVLDHADYTGSLSKIIKHREDIFLAKYRS